MGSETALALAAVLIGLILAVWVHEIIRLYCDITRDAMRSINQVDKMNRESNRIIEQLRDPQ